MKFGDIKIGKEFGSNIEYLEWMTERNTKTRNGARPMGHKRAFNAKAYETINNNNDHCAVKVFKEFINHRPINMCHDDSPLFLAVRYNIDYNTESIWYHAKPLGKNSIG